jgi:glyoxylase-like metal-dependent hydrolase (beta-lactamase superfamily II)
MSTLRELSEQLLSSSGDAIDAAQPMAPRFIAEPVAAGSYFVSSFANVTAFDTDDGLVLVDTGSFLLAEPTRAKLRGVSKQPVHTAVWTHGHVDHCFGVELYEKDSARHVHVIAHEAVERRFARYQLTRGWNIAINKRQFQTHAEFPGEFRAPDQTYSKDLDVTVGGRRFELHHALGETDDHTWVWVPDAGVVCMGDLFIWASPNCGNPQKAQRYPREWAAALREMDNLGPEVLCPGHGPPIWGRQAVHRALDETASFLEALVDQVVTLMNRGARLDEILATVDLAPALLERPYLQPSYEERAVIVRTY